MATGNNGHPVSERQLTELAETASMRHRLAVAKVHIALVAGDLVTLIDDRNKFAQPLQESLERQAKELAEILGHTRRALHTLAVARIRIPVSLGESSEPGSALETRSLPHAESGADRRPRQTHIPPRSAGAMPGAAPLRLGPGGDFSQDVTPAIGSSVARRIARLAWRPGFLRRRPRTDRDGRGDV